MISLEKDDYDNIGVGIRDALIQKTDVLDWNDKAELLRIVTHQLSVVATAQHVATRLGSRYDNFDIPRFADACGMEAGSDGKWRVPDGPHVPAP